MSTLFIFFFTNNSPKLRLLLIGFKHRVVGWSASPLALLHAGGGVMHRFFSRFFKIKFEEGFLLNPHFWEIPETESSLQWDNHQLCW